MTAAQRQARRRERLRKAKAEREAQEGKRRAYQPPYGYNRAKEQLINAGHHFQRARREFGFEEGVFVDGAFLGSGEVIALAELAPAERQQRLAKARHDWKDLACGSVKSYMDMMQVSLDELIQYLTRRDATKAKPGPRSP